MKNRLPYYENSFLFFLSLDSTQKFDKKKTSISCQIRSTCVQFSRAGIILQSAPKLMDKKFLLIKVKIMIKEIRK